MKLQYIDPNNWDLVTRVNEKESRSGNTQKLINYIKQFNLN